MTTLNNPRNIPAGLRLIPNTKDRYRVISPDSIETATVRQYRCLRCDYRWIPQRKYWKGDKHPTGCPCCKSTYWNIEKRSRTSNRMLTKKLLKKHLEDKQNDGNC